ncbi:MAG: hypothetical protein AAGU25_05590 [bacterium]
MKGEDLEQENEPVTQPECPSKIPLPLRGQSAFSSWIFLMLAELFLTASTFRWLEAWILLGLAIVNMVLLQPCYRQVRHRIFPGVW